MKPDTPLSSAVSRNIEELAAYYAREEQRVGRAQRLLERFSAAIGKPWSLALILLFVLTWISYNVLAPTLGWKGFDPPPFPALQGVVSFAALMITTVVLIGQNRLATLEHKREQLELQVNMLTEQKTTKLVHLLEELRHDLPMVRDRHDPDVARLQQPADATGILSALDRSQERPAQDRGERGGRAE